MRRPLLESRALLSVAGGAGSSIQTGPRLGKALALKWSDIELDAASSETICSYQMTA